MRVLITGASRGIGAAIARVFAREHGKDLQVALLARSVSQPSHPTEEGTLLDTVRAVEQEGGVAIPLGVDMRCADELKTALVDATRALDRKVDVLINNASALHLGKTLSVKQMDLLYQVNTRASLMCMETCMPYLETSDREDGGAIVTLSPPIRLGKLDWIAPSPAYTVSKYSMTLQTLAHASPLVRANTLWPRYMVATSATRRLETVLGVEGAYSRGRPPEDVARAVHHLAVRATALNARTLYDDDVLDDLPPTDARLDAYSEPRVSSWRGGGAET